jgi:hypothetical protein
MPKSPKIRKIRKSRKASKKMSLKELVNILVDMNIPTQVVDDKIIIIKDKKLSKAYGEEVAKNIKKDLDKNMPEWMKF